MRPSERVHRPAPAQIEFPTRYVLDEARFRGGQARIRNEEETPEPTNHLA